MRRGALAGFVLAAAGLVVPAIVPGLADLALLRPLFVALAAAAVALLAWPRRCWPALLAAGLAAPVALVVAAGLPMAFPGAGACPPPRRLTIVQWNLSQDNRDPGGAAAWIAAQQPDVALLQEAKGGAATVPARLAKVLPFVQSCHAHVHCSTLVLAALPPLRQVPLAHGDPENRRALSAALLDTGTATLVSLHLSRPWPIGRQGRETAELAARLAGEDPRRLIIAGDFNAVPGMAAPAGLAARLGLRSAAAPGASWPAFLPLLAIDQLLIGEDWQVVAATRGPAGGSDHRPQRVTLCRR